MFLFGKQDIGPIQKEIDRFGDALVGDFIDSFHNLTFKDAMLLQWAQDSCHARFILKGDDDVFVSKLIFTPFCQVPCIRTGCTVHQYN